MTDLILHPSSKQRLDSLKTSPPQSLLIYGERGVGLSTIAREIAGNSPIMVVPEGESQTLSIKTERVRQLYDETKGTSSKPRFVIIDDADAMTHSAQSAFLKLLEEPNKYTYFILTSHDQDKLLPTIISRVQSYHLPLPTKEATLQYIYSVVGDENMQRTVAFLAPRHPSLIYTYAHNADIFEKDSTLMSDARKCVTATKPYDRQVIALSHASTRAGALEFVDACIHLLHYSLGQETTDRGVQSIERYLTTRDGLLRNLNVKLALAQLMVY